MRRSIVLLAGLIALGAVGHARAQKQGYWFYQDPPKEEETPEAEKELPPPPSEDALLKMLPKEVEKVIEDYRQHALMTMKPEHVQWYYKMQDFARRRAVAFANVTELVMLQNPDLNMNTVYPTNPQGSTVRTSQRQNAVEQRLAAERGTAALVLLTSRGCGFCEAQRGTLRYFQQRHGWDVREFDINDNPQMVAKFSTNYTPTTIVIFRGTQEWMPVAVGVETVAKVEESVYRAVRMMRGETQAAQFTLPDYQHGSALDPIRRPPP